MWRSRKVVIIVVVAAVVLLAGSIGGIALAQTGTPAPGAGKTLMARVAAKLNIEQPKLESAFAEAQREMRDEALKNRLQRMVSDNRTTQAEADAYYKWWQSKPSTPVGPGIGTGPGFGGRFGRMGGMRGPGGPLPPPPGTMPTK